MGLGGLDAVRAYPQGEAAGDDAFLVNLEARRNLGRVGGGSVLAGALFFDYGNSRINHHDWSGSDRQRNLSGIGGSLSWGTRADGATRLSFARRLAGGPATAEKDSRYRIWIVYEEAL
jgi:hemolysin activation/secretion protein